MRIMIMRYVTAAILGVSLLVTGCAATLVKRPLPPPAEVRLGPVMQLLAMPTASDKTRVVLDNSGQGHVIVASTKRNEVHHIVVGPDGIAGREIIRNASPGSIDAAVDRAGIIHVLIDTEYWVNNGGEWQRSTQTPWEKAGVKPMNAHFLPGAADVTWAFTVRGKDVGSPWRLDWYAVGGMGGGVIWPWYTHGTKLIVVPEKVPACTTWTVFDLNDKRDIGNWYLAADAEKNIYAVYDISRVFFAESVEVMHTRFRLGGPPANDVSEPAAPSIANGSAVLHNISGQTVGGQFAGRRLSSSASLSVDPETGTALFAMAHNASWVIHNNAWEQAVQVPVSNFRDIKLAPGGSDSFHAAVIGGGDGYPVQYLLFTDGAWSVPAELGLANVSTFWGDPCDAVQIGSDGRNRSLVVWPVEDGIVGRWVEFIKKREK